MKKSDDSSVAFPAVFPIQGWLGLVLVAIFWPLNWLLTPPQLPHGVFVGFFPLWLGYILTVDGLVFWRKGTSLLTRSWRRFLGMFVISALVWWLFEAINLRTQNWHYQGRHLFGPVGYALLASLSFSTVIPAVFGTAELAASLGFLGKLGKGPIIRPAQRTVLMFFLVGLGMLALMLIQPVYFFPFAWLSVYFILEPINIWLGHRNLAIWTARGDWRPIVALWLGVLVCGVFWEMWNYFSFPKWIYTIPGVDFWHLFEMPAPGYLGYLPFAMELYAIYNLVLSLVDKNDDRYVRIDPDLTVQ
jgi:hypothetical protein